MQKPKNRSSELEIYDPLEVNAYIDLGDITNDVFIEQAIKRIPGMIEHMRSDTCTPERRAKDIKLLKRLLHSMCGGKDKGFLATTINVPIEIIELLK